MTCAAPSDAPVRLVDVDVLVRLTDQSTAGVDAVAERGGPTVRPHHRDDRPVHPQLATEIAWLEQALATGLPTLGICLGAQLIAADELADRHGHPRTGLRRAARTAHEWPSARTAGSMRAGRRPA